MDKGCFSFTNQAISINTLSHRVFAHRKASKRRDSAPSFDHTVREQARDGQSLNFKRLGATSVAQLGVAALGKGWVIPREPRLDLIHACSPECINTYGLVSKPSDQCCISSTRQCSAYEPV
jgi:hypothetical protein